MILSARVTRRLASRRLFSSSIDHLSQVRPAVAPKQTPDVKGIRASVELHERNILLRNYLNHQGFPRRISELAKESSEVSKLLVDPRRKLKQLEKDIGNFRQKGDEAAVLQVVKQIAPLRKQCDDLERSKALLDEELHRLALALPNLTSTDTPHGKEARLLSYLNYDPAHPPLFGEGKDHSIIGQELGILDFSSAAKSSGWGFYYFLDEAALLEQALIQYALSTAMRHGWRIVTPPSLIYSHIADSCGFQPRDVNDEQQIWQVAQQEKDTGKPRRSLTATAEIPLAALYANKDISQHSLPIKLVGSSRCYRAEAGARGVDTKGLYRVHEFTKVEMFAWTDAPSTPDAKDEAEVSAAVFDEMLAIQTHILSSLGLPCRVLEMPTSDLGASAFRKIDIEAIFPSRLQRDDGWGELSSLSMCTDYQSRRLDTRIKDINGARSRFPYTLNGTALAVPRVLAAILEHGWDDTEKCVWVPEVLRPLVGFDKIGPR